ncbi:hypothetical protein BGX38DRAFT_1268187 [Terfezia claveryi]|nr:hypothetical protein BGX38DRAFT_1268187 [Terfezia claveryi]
MPSKTATVKSRSRAAQTTRPKSEANPITGKGKGKAKALSPSPSLSPSTSLSLSQGSSSSSTLSKPGAEPASKEAGPEPTTPSRKMELVLRDIAKANAARRAKKRKAVLDGYISAVEEVVKRRAGKWMGEGEVMDREWRGGVVGRLTEVVRRKEVLEEKICRVLGMWEDELGRVVGVVGSGVKVGCEGSGDDDEEGGSGNGNEEEGEME